MNDTVYSPISFLRTKRFWFRWAVPGLLLALWVEGMVFEQFGNFCFSTPSSEIDYSFSMREGTLSLRVFREIYPLGFSIPGSGWTYLSSGLNWHPGWKLLPPLFHADDHVLGCLASGQLRIVAIPLWLPFSTWLIWMILWSRHQKRKQATLQ